MQPFSAFPARPVAPVFVELREKKLLWFSSLVYGAGLPGPHTLIYGYEEIQTLHRPGIPRKLWRKDFLFSVIRTKVVSSKLKGAERCGG